MGSHDGIGLKPARGFLKDKQLNTLVETWITQHQALPNYATLPGGKQIVYEVCATPWHLINRPHSNESFTLMLNRYMAVLALGLSIRGIPANYINGLLGSPNYYSASGLDEHRTINRQIFDIRSLNRYLLDKKSQMKSVTQAVKNIITIRQKEPLFSPSAPVPQNLNLQQKSLIATVTQNSRSSLVNITNVDSISHRATLDFNKLKINGSTAIDIISGSKFTISSGRIIFSLDAYQPIWLKIKS